jgi:hypothetical protein
MEVATLIAAFLENNRLHAVRFTKVFAMGWCGVDSAEVICYVPSWAFDGRAKHGDADVCVKCSAALCALARPA